MTCPICKKPKSKTSHPFCSIRCQDIDLSKWLIGGYDIASDEQIEESEATDSNVEAIDK